MAALRRGGGGQRGQMFAEEGEDGGVIEGASRMCLGMWA